MSETRIPIESIGDNSSCSAAEPFALQVLGDSMEPEFENGCIIIIDPEGKAEAGSYVLAVHNEEYIFRQLQVQEEKLILQPLNPNYEPIEINGLADIKGVITQKGGTRRSMRKRYVV